MRRQAVRTGETVAVGPKMGSDELRLLLRQAGIKDAIVAPLRSGATVVGSLEVTGHLGDMSQFAQKQNVIPALSY